MAPTPESNLRETSIYSDAEEEPRTDLEGLVEYLTQLRGAGIRLCEVTYAVNRWALYGFIPMTHHGFIFKTTAGEYFTLDFGRKGISWDVMDEMPGLPDNTFYTKLYRIDVDTSIIQTYCEETPPFNFPFYDCETWSKGLLDKLGLDTTPGQSSRKTKEVCSPSLDKLTESSAKKPTMSAGRKQRTGACV